MPITITKQKPKASEPVAVTESYAVAEVSALSDEMLADAFGELEDAIAAIMTNPVFVRMAEVKEELVSRLLTFDPLDAIKIKGAHWQVEAGPCGKEQRKVINPLAVMNFVGPEAFAKIAKVGIVDAEKYLLPHQFEQVTSKPGHTTTRKIKATYLG